MGQKEAIEQIAGPCVVLAGAGTGKTHTMVEKVKHLLACGFKPEKIACITFSNEAAAQLLRRLHGVTMQGKEPVVRTFHGLSADILRMHADTAFSILEPDEAKIALHTMLRVPPMLCSTYVQAMGIAKDVGISYSDLENYVADKTRYLGDQPLDSVLERIQFELQTSYLKRVDSSALADEVKDLKKLFSLKKFLSVWRAYEKIKVQKNYKDYSDLTQQAIGMIKQHPDLSSLYHYVIVDEFQDTNKTQLHLLYALVPQGNVTVVGDLNQSIYRFRGAYSDTYHSFIDHFAVLPEQIYAIDMSYRSSDVILRTAHRLIAHNYEKKEECFLVKNKFFREGDRVKVFSLTDSKEEARKVAEIVEHEQRLGTKLEEICVLFRTHQQGRIFKRVFDSRAIPYNSLSKRHLLQVPSVSLIRQYLRIVHLLQQQKSGGEEAWWHLAYTHRFSDDDLIQIGNFIKKNKDVENLSSYLFQHLASLSLSKEGSAAANALITTIGSLKPLSLSATEFVGEAIKRVIGVPDESTAEGRVLVQELQSFIELSQKYGSLYAPDLGSFLHYLDVVEQLHIELPVVSLEEKGVRLMTLHATKGLEFKVVIVTNLCDGRFPSTTQFDSFLPESLFPEFKDKLLSDESLAELQRDYSLREERRLCYVAFTRAKERLYLTYASKYSSRSYEPSRFLQEIQYTDSPDIIFEEDGGSLYVEPEPEIRPASFYMLFSPSAPEVEKLPPRIIHSPSLTFSPSSLLLFNDCQKAFEYKYIFHMPEKKPISWDSIRLGSFVHELLDMGVKEGFASYAAFEQAARALHLADDWESVDLAEALLLIKIFFERNKHKYSSRSKTEQQLSLQLEGMRFVGYADRIDFRDDGIEIVDYKTGATHISALHRNWQLGYYALAAARFGTVRRLTLDMLKHEKPIEFIVNAQGIATSVHSSRVSFNVYEVKNELVETGKKILKCVEQGFSFCSPDKNCEFCQELVR
ncbi:MAG TPA: ATP-dependent DNA helicase [Candidatus Nanoarchaeia archaeon]|nr:ATP-dependent DNA helicase [Candidatus Nanoarchaeia archaeon]